MVDRIDLKILSILQAEGRIRNQALAERVALSPSACLVRVRNLETSGFITGYTARIAADRVKSTTIVFAEVTLTRHHPADFAAFEAFVSQTSEIVEAAQVSGAFDYLLKVVVNDIRSWLELSDRLLNSELGIEKILSHVMMKSAKSFVGFPL